MNTITPPSSRGRTWFQALADKAQPVNTGLGSVVVTDATWGSERVRLLALVIALVVLHARLADRLMRMLHVA